MKALWGETFWEKKSFPPTALRSAPPSPNGYAFGEERALGIQRAEMVRGEGNFLALAKVSLPPQKKEKTVFRLYKALVRCFSEEGEPFVVYKSSLPFSFKK